MLKAFWLLLEAGVTVLVATLLRYLVEELGCFEQASASRACLFGGIAIFERLGLATVLLKNVVRG